jgi:hypothetical protein
MLNKRFFFWSFVVVLVMLVSAVGPTPAYADEISTTDSQSAGESTTPTDPATSQPSEPILTQVPVDTTVTVLNAEGETVSLASQESADLIATSDPVWCPEGQTPTPGVNGCTTSFPSFNDLINYLKVNENDTAYQQAGTIYIQANTYGGEETIIDFNSYGLNNLNNYNLTLTGGWDTNSNIIDPAQSTQFDIPIVIGTNDKPWGGSLTFNNIQIQNVNNNTALTAYSQNDIALSNVEISNVQGGDGATLVSVNGDVTVSNSSLNNTNTGANITAGGDVTIENNSTFDNNKLAGAVITAGGKVDISNTTFNNNGAATKKNAAGGGLEIGSEGAVSLTNVEANNNGTFGASIEANNDVTITNSFFSGNVAYKCSCKGLVASGGYGLQVISTGIVSLDGVTASNNYLFGANLEGTDVKVTNGIFNNNGSGPNKTPTGKGLDIKSSGEVSLNDVEANNNQLSGANIQAVSSVTILNSIFSGNKSYVCSCNGTSYYGYGLQVVTPGNIAMDNVTANSNNLVGAFLKGADIAISNSDFSNNGTGSGKTPTGEGLDIKSTSNVSLYNISANNNQLFGADIQAAISVSIGGVNFFSGNKSYVCSCDGKTFYGYGLKVVAGSNVAVSGVTAEGNNKFGAHLEGASVSVSDSSFSNNGSGSTPTGKGLEVISLGDVSLSGVTANNNQLFGANIQATGGVSIGNSFFSGNKSYVCSCGEETYYGYGLRITTAGDVALNNVAANNNYLYGTYIEGANISVANSTFNANGTGTGKTPTGKGLEIKSTSFVSIYNIQANDNQLFGANIQSSSGVFINSSFFNGNKSYVCSCNGTTYYGYGLQVIAQGDVFVDDVTAMDNYLFGAHLEGQNVSVTGSLTGSLFNNNGTGTGKTPTGKGLEIISAGEVTLANVQANNNQLFGANIQATSTVKITNSFFSGNKSYVCSCGKATNYGYGLQVTTNGPVTLDGVTANDNNLFGASISGPDVTVTNSSFNNNGAGGNGSGLSITTSGQVTLNNVTANNNGLNGVAVTGACTNVIVVDGTFTNNGQYGLNILNAFLNLSGSQTFDNNKSGNIFQNPGTCVGNGTSLDTGNGTSLDTGNGTGLNTDNGTSLNTDNGTSLNTDNGTSLNIQAPQNFHRGMHYRDHAHHNIHSVKPVHHAHRHMRSR